MGLYNFKERFVPFIQDGTKTHTIRAIRKHPQRIGWPMHLFTGLRTKYAKRIIPEVNCKDVKTIFILANLKVILVDSIFNEPDCQAFLEDYNKGKIHISIKELSTKERDELAWNDGFRYSDKPKEKKDCFLLMTRYWTSTQQLPFYGHINYWNAPDIEHENKLMEEVKQLTEKL